MSVGDSRIEATANHPFWVVKGTNLCDRSVPEKLSPGEDEGQALSGRWVNSQELEVGDLLFGEDGQYHCVEQIDHREVAAVPVSNLTVRNHHTFAVGSEPVLVHNYGWCDYLSKTKGDYFYCIPGLDSLQSIVG